MATTAVLGMAVVARSPHALLGLMRLTSAVMNMISVMVEKNVTVGILLLNQVVHDVIGIYVIVLKMRIVREI